MRFIIKKGLILLVVLSITLSWNAKAESPTIPIPTTISGKIAYYSSLYGVDKNKIDRIVKCESSYDVDVQSYATYKKGNRWGFPEGTREKSYGLAQIHLPDHPEITYKQATNADFALNYLVKNYANKTDKWTCG